MNAAPDDVPVIAFQDELSDPCPGLDPEFVCFDDNRDVMLVQCDDADCAGGDETPVKVDASPAHFAVDVVAHL